MENIGKVRYQLRVKTGKSHGTFKVKEGNNTRKKETKEGESQFEA